MAKSKQRIWLNAVLLVGGIGFLTFSLLPFLEGLTPSVPQAPSPQSEAEQKRLQEAKGFELVLQKDPNNVFALRSLLEIRLQQQDLAGAHPLLEKLASLNPAVPEYTILLAQTQTQLGDREAAARTYRTFLTQQPTNLTALVGLSELYIQEGRPSAAESLLQEALPKAQAPKDDILGIQLQIGRIYLVQGKEAPAVALFDQLMRQYPQDFRPVFAKAQVRRAQNKQTEAKTLLDKALALAPPQYRDQIKALTQEASPTPTPTASPGQVGQPNQKPQQSQGR